MIYKYNLLKLFLTLNLNIIDSVSSLFLFFLCHSFIPSHENELFSPVLFFTWIIFFIFRLLTLLVCAIFIAVTVDHECNRNWIRFCAFVKSLFLFLSPLSLGELNKICRARRVERKKIFTHEKCRGKQNRREKKEKMITVRKKYLNEDNLFYFRTRSSHSLTLLSRAFVIEIQFVFHWCRSGKWRKFDLYRKMNPQRERQRERDEKMSPLARVANCSRLLVSSIHSCHQCCLFLSLSFDCPLNPLTYRTPSEWNIHSQWTRVVESVSQSVSHFESTVFFFFTLNNFSSLLLAFHVNVVDIFTLLTTTNFRASETLHSHWHTDPFHFHQCTRMQTSISLSLHKQNGWNVCEKRRERKKRKRVCITGNGEESYGPFDLSLSLSTHTRRRILHGNSILHWEREREREFVFFSLSFSLRVEWRCSWWCWGLPFYPYFFSLSFSYKPHQSPFHPYASHCVRLPHSMQACRWQRG